MTPRGKRYGVVVSVDRTELLATDHVCWTYRISWYDGDSPVEMEGVTRAVDRWALSQMRDPRRTLLAVYKDFENRIRDGSVAGEVRWQSVSPFLQKAILT